MARNWAVFLRGVNVGGHGKVPMAELRKHLPQIGASEVATYIQSGNIVLRHPVQTGAELAELIQQLVSDHFGFAPKVLALRPDTLKALLAEIPQPEGVEGKNIYIYLTDAIFSPDEINALTAHCTQGETLTLLDEALVVVAPNGIGKSKLAAPLERLLDGRATARNLNSLQKVQALLEG